MNLPQQKIQLRQQMRTLRRSLSSTQQREASHKLSARLARHPAFIHAQNIAFYLANDGEISPWPLLQLAIMKHKNVFLPSVKLNATMEFRQFSNKRQLKKNRYKILEPQAASPRIALKQLDLIFVPLVAFDTKGNRLGMGGGFYDRALAFKRSMPKIGPKLIGLAHSLQQHPDLTIEQWDIPLDAIATEKNIFSA